MPKAATAFKYYALHYLNLWVSQDKGPCEALTSNDNEEKLRQIAKAAVAYRVARNLPTRYDKDKGLQRYGPVLKVLESLNRADFRGEHLLPSIKKVRDRLSANYGGHGTLSLTTKFLWLKMKSPIIIYDARAREALDTPLGDIDAYYSRWRDKFTRCEQQIRDACASLERVHEYTKNPEVTTREYIRKIAGRRWFRERVFDVYLWHRAADGVSQSTLRRHQNR